MPRRNPVEHQRRVNEAVKQSRMHPGESLTDEQREEFHRSLIAKGWKVGKKRQRPKLRNDQCQDCWGPCEPSDDPLDRLCDRCRAKRRPA